MEALEAILTRRSIRKYTSETVSEEQIKTLLTAAMSAPSAGNQQSWHFIVVDNREMLKKIAVQHPHAKMAESAAVGVLVCGDTSLERFPGYWIQDCSAATENLLLAAHGLGLGAVWTGIYPRPDRLEVFKKLFNLPENILPLCFVVIGHPDEKREQPERYNPQRVRRNQW